jgi:DNA ligase-1
MQAFAALYAALDASTATNDKLAALRAYFAQAPAADAAWALYFLAGGRPRRTVPTALLREVACAEAQLPGWLFEECYQAVGDLAETIAWVIPAPGARSPLGLAAWLEQRLLPLRAAAVDEQRAALGGWLRELDAAGRFLLVKLIGGGLRVGVARGLVQRALADARGVDPRLLAQRLIGYTDVDAPPSAARYEALFAAGDDAAGGLPYPFFLAHPLPAEAGPEPLGAVQDWLAEWKFDGIRAQLVRRAGRAWLWSRGEELITDRFPELDAVAAALPDGTVLDGEIVAWRDGAPAPFRLLQQRIARKRLSARVLAEAPARFIAFDLLQWQGADWRERPQSERRARLEHVGVVHGLAVSPRLHADDWAGHAAHRDRCRASGTEGLMLKDLDAPYGIGRSRGGWWKWKVDPLRIDAVLVYAQAGHGRRAGVYTDYSFALWNRAPRDAAEAADVADAIARREPARAGALQLVTFAKAYSGLSDAEFAEVDRVIRATTIEKFGPVRSVRPTLVFELGFEGVNLSPRHKSGLAVRFPRMLRIRRDKPLQEADTIGALRALGSLPRSPGERALEGIGPSRAGSSPS